MGIRIHLMMGYGLTDIECKPNGKITDRRINPDGWLLSSDDDKDDKYTMRKFRNFVQRELRASPAKSNPDYSDNMIYLNYCKDKVYVHECIQHDSEFGLPNVLCLIPPGLVHKWSRRDDHIDYYMADSMESWVKPYKNGNFYPYQGIIDTHTGQRVVEPSLSIINSVLRDSESVLCSNEVKARYIHEIPGCLKYFIKYTNLFTSDDVLFELKPILYCYWA